MRRLLIAGCGFLGKTAAFAFQEAGWEIFATTHSSISAAALHAEGIPALQVDLGDRQSVLSLRDKIGHPVDAWLHCASSGGGGPDAYRHVYLAGAENLLHAFPGARGLFTSSTSVYGQKEGEEVTEESAAEPSRETGRILLATEREVLERGGVVLRLAGIYGPGRSVLLRKFLEGSAVLEAGGNRWINQIHRDDAARAWLFLAENSSLTGIYNGADSTPLRQIDLYREMAVRLGKDLPPEGPANPDRKRGLTSKRVSNAKLRAAGWQPEFPAYFSDWDRLLASAEK